MAHACPARSTYCEVYMNTGVAPMAWSGSTISVPLNAAGSRGRRTTTVVVYGRPPSSPATNHSSSTYPAASSDPR